MIHRSLSSFAFALLIAATASAADSAPAPAAASATVDTATLKEYSYKDSGFAVSLPGDPEVSTSDKDTVAGKIAIHTYIYVKGNALLAVGVNDFPADLITKSNASDVLNNALEGALESVKGKLVSKKEIQLDNKYPGIEFQLTGEIAKGTYRVYLVGSRMYQVFSLGANGAEPLPVAGKFLDSFRILAK